MKYWDDVNCCVTDDNSYAPIYDGGEMYIETYDIVPGKSRFSIAYTEEIKNNGNMYLFRKQMCEKHGLLYSDLHKLIRLRVPTEKYKEIYKEEHDQNGKYSILRTQ